MGHSLGEFYRITVAGQSHSRAMTLVIDGLPAGIKIPEERIRHELERRRPGKSPLSSARRETDAYEILSGAVEGHSCGAPLVFLIPNNDARSRDYEALRHRPRPSHADYPAAVRYGKYRDIRGGGEFSGRLTAPLCIAGALAAELLETRGVKIYSHILSIHGVEDPLPDPKLMETLPEAFPALHPEPLKAEILRAKEEGDSVGGVVEIRVTGLPAGIGEPLFDSCESRLAAAVFSIPGIRGIEFGTGFDAARLRGSEHNDPWLCAETGEITSRTNHHGGVIGGLTSGMPLEFRAAVKPTPSISRPQETVNLETGEPEMLEISGRHDPCIVPRAVPVLEMVTALTLLDLFLARGVWEGGF